MAALQATETLSRRFCDPAPLCDDRSAQLSHMPTTTITVDANLKERLADLASQTGQNVDDFVEAFLRRVAEADIRFDRGVPVFPPCPRAPILTVEDVDRLKQSDEA